MDFPRLFTGMLEIQNMATITCFIWICRGKADHQIEIGKERSKGWENV